MNNGEKYKKLRGNNFNRCYPFFILGISKKITSQSTRLFYVILRPQNSLIAPLLMSSVSLSYAKYTLQLCLVIFFTMPYLNFFIAKFTEEALKKLYSITISFFKKAVIDESFFSFFFLGHDFF
jgi:hypothetical protein